MSKKGYLRAEEYRAIRELLGFSQREAQEFHGVQNLSTIKRWESGYSTVSELACDKIVALLKRIDWSIRSALDVWENARRPPLTLIIYPDGCYKKFASGFADLPNSVHRAMIYRTYSELKEKGAEVGIILFDPSDYMTYLGIKGIKDSPDSRAMWAAERYSLN